MDISEDPKIHSDNEPKDLTHISTSISTAINTTGLLMAHPDNHLHTSSNGPMPGQSIKKVEDEGKSSEDKLTWSQKFVTWRCVIMLLLQASFVVSMLLRHCLPMAVVCMVKPRRSSPASSSLSHGSTGMFNKTGNESGSRGGKFSSYQLSINDSTYTNKTLYQTSDYEFDWSSEVQGLVLSSIMFSMFAATLVVSVLKTHLGSKLAMSVVSLASTILTFLSPLAARTSPYSLVAIRILLGLCLGGIPTVIGDTVAWWAPKDERLTMMSLVYSGLNVGVVLAYFISGYLCLIPLDNGWPFVFYTFGVISFVWCLFWHFLSSQKPEEHPYISDKEKMYIIAHRLGMEAQSGKKDKVPYRQILSSLPVLAYMFLATCFMWSNQIMNVFLPQFFNRHMGFSVQETGTMTSLTNLFRVCGSVFWTNIGNRLTSIIGLGKSRKICICVGIGLGGVIVSAVGFFDESHRWVVFGLLIFAMLNHAVRSSSMAAVPLDMAPRFAGLLVGLSMSAGNSVSFSGPLIISAIITNDTQEEWRTAWIVIGCSFILGTVVFLLLGKASMQSWAVGKPAEQPPIMVSVVELDRQFTNVTQAPSLTHNTQNGAVTLSRADVTTTSLSVIVDMDDVGHDITSGNTPRACVGESPEVSHFVSTSTDCTQGTVDENSSKGVLDITRGIHDSDKAVNPGISKITQTEMSDKIVLMGCTETRVENLSNESSPSYISEVINKSFEYSDNVDSYVPDENQISRL